MTSSFARHLTLLFLCILAGVLLAAVITWQMPTRYASSATLQFRPQGSASGNPGTNQEIILQTDILRPVIENLGLEKKWRTDAAETLSRLRSGLEVRDVRHTTLVQLTMEDPDPELAAEIANAVATEFQRQALALQQEAVAKGLEQLKNEIETQKQETEDWPARLKAIRIEGGIIDLDPEGTSENSPSVEQALAEQKETVAALRALQERSMTMTHEEILAALTTAGIDGVLEKTLAARTQLSAEETRLRDSGLASHHPTIRSLQAQREVQDARLQNLVSILKNSLPAELQTAEERLQALEALAAAGPLPEPSRETRVRYEAAKNRYLASKALVAAAEKKLREERAMATLIQQPVVIWEQAEPSDHSRSPRPDLNLLLGGVLGGLAGLLLVLVSLRK